MAPAVLDSQLPSPTRYAEFFLCGAFIFLSFATLPLSSQQINNRTDDDRQALLYFKSGISQDPRGVLASWRNDSLNFCSWKGVTCSTTVPIRVVSIDLRSLQLGGQLSNCIATLTSLVRIDISNNGLSGKIPDELGALPRLETLMLTGNSLEGSIPASLGNASTLSSILLAENNLRGTIPRTLGQMLKLQVIDLSSNLLSGSVPPLGSLSDLNRLLLGNNTLQSNDWSFLISLTNCSQLSWFLMDQNILNGSLPKSVGNLSTKLERLNLGGNEISGTIPAEIGNLVNLTLLEMDQNRLSGIIPSSIGNLKNWVVLRLSKNKLSGDIPTTIGNFPQLNMLYLDDNLLFGNIPESLGMCIRLNMLNLSVNNLDGFIPSEILSISSLSLGLDLSNNNLAGTMPLQIGSLINLDLLNVSNNMLSGEISPTLGLCAVLSSLQMESNMLSGIIPENFQKLGAIHQIDLSKTYMGQFQNSSITSRPYIILTYPTTNWKDQFQLLVFSQIQMQLHWMVTRRYVNILPYLHCHSAPLHQ